MEKRRGVDKERRTNERGRRQKRGGCVQFCFAVSAAEHTEARSVCHQK